MRSNFWLTIHVLTEVSSYAAFGVAWALGLIAMVYYLTATYRRSPRLAELALPLVPGIPLLATGGFGVAASYGAFGTQWATGDLLFYIFAIMGGIGGMISLGAILALVGELVNRLRFRETCRGGRCSCALRPSFPPSPARRLQRGLVCRSRTTRRPGRDSRPGGRHTRQA